MTGLLAELYERCELEAQHPLPMTAVNIFSQRRISRNIGPANVGMAHSNQLNFFEHSEERCNRVTRRPLFSLSQQSRITQQVGMKILAGHVLKNCTGMVSAGL